MCYSVGQDKTVDKINKGKSREIKLSAKKKAETLPVAYYISGFGFPNLPIITSESPNEIDIMKWGLIPSFINDSIKAKEYATNTLNAKSETIFEKVSFKNSIMNQRCLILATGFFEWRSEGGLKYPYYIKLKEQEILSFGGVYSTWINNATGESESTFSIITTEANPLMEKIHNVKKRMPLLFTEEMENEWLKPNLNKNEIIELMKPLDENLLSAHTIRRISPSNIDPYSPKIIEEFEYPELALFD